jgi:hypothetical protein
MAHFAEVVDGIVTRVIVISNGDAPGELSESEPLGVAFIANVLGLEGVWVQTSYNHNFRHKYAGPGDSYLAESDVFVEPKPWDSWILNTETWEWQAPTPRPDDGKIYDWSEETLTWIEVTP